MIEHVPEGYEIYEHPENARVFLRLKRPQIITDIEKHLGTDQLFDSPFF